MLPVIAILVLVVGLIGGVIWFTSKNKQAPASAMMESPTPTVEVLADQTVSATGEAEIKQFTIEGTSYKFSPATLKVKKGDIVQITFKNTGGMHDFVLDEFDIKTNTIGDGEEEQVEFTADKAGSFEYYCSVGNHRAMGMKGTLTVE